MLFTSMKGKRRILFILGTLLSLFFVGLLIPKKKQNSDFEGTVKLALRDVGNQLLLANEDSTSLVLPVVALASNKYKLSFQKELAITPDSLLHLVKRSFKKVGLASKYRVEVIQCVDSEVAYGYEVSTWGDKDIVPCLGRELPMSCYTINVRFLKAAVPSIWSKVPYGIGVLVGICLMVIGLRKNKQQEETVAAVQNEIENSANENIIGLGSYDFYPEQNKLVKQAVEISLSKKECELLAILTARPNQVIKREELVKLVWEDQGVVVGRSLDTYISKLRKKLKDDTSIKITNIHGVGYKFEIGV